MSLDVVPGAATGGSGDVPGDALEALGRAPVRPAGEGRAVPWALVAVLAVCLAGADMFHVISLQGAVGSIERNQSAFALWLRISALSAPFFAVAVVLVLRTARRRFGPSLRSPRPVLLTGSLLVLAATVVGMGAAAVNAGVDYRLQAAMAERTAATSHHGQQVVPGATGGNDARCVAACRTKRDTLKAHAKGLAMLAPVVVVTNVVVVGWVVAMAGGSLDARRRRTPRAAA